MKTGVIFDMDGVLVNSGPAHLASWRVLAAKHGVEFTDEQFARTFGQTSREIIRNLWGSEVSDEEIEEYDAEKEAIYRDMIEDNVPVMPGAIELVQSLHAAGLILAVATSGPPENLALVLGRTGLKEYFTATINGFDIKHGKPAPDCFLLAAERAGLKQDHPSLPGRGQGRVSAPCVVVEDAPVGIRAALAAGMKAIGLVGTHPPERLREAGAQWVVNQLSEITPADIKKLVGG
jgi:beta-phosphoglucomutase